MNEMREDNKTNFHVFHALQVHVPSNYVCSSSSDIRQTKKFGSHNITVAHDCSSPFASIFKARDKTWHAERHLDFGHIWISVTVSRVMQDGYLGIFGIVEQFFGLGVFLAYRELES